MNEFDENAAARFINASLDKKFGLTYPDDEIINIIDMIWDWYDDNGFTDIDFDDEAEEDENAVAERITAYVKKLLAKDTESPVEADHIRAIVDAEIEYENSLDPLA
ncbi:MAG: hypothetical protein K2K47_01310 [Duncaniella sp.]|nr:hypothetical protein [Duncaniella sp.]